MGSRVHVVLPYSPVWWNVAHVAQTSSMLK
jgi:hypothetical protein